MQEHKKLMQKCLKIAVRKGFVKDSDLEISKYIDVMENSSTEELEQHLRDLKNK